MNAENIITPTLHDRQEWARMSEACEQAGKAVPAQLYKAASSLEGPMATWTYDALQNNYRLWLVFGGDAMPEEGLAL